MIILGITYIAIALLSCFVDCYSYYLLLDECRKNDNVTEIWIEPWGARSGIILQSYVPEGNERQVLKLYEMDCRLTMSSDPKTGIALCVVLAKFVKGCKANEYLQLTSSEKTVKLCHTYYGYNYHSLCYRFDDPNVTLTYETVNGVPPNFRLVANTFHELPCRMDEFQCRKERVCISEAFLCDGFNNCIDFSDEVIGRRSRYCIHKEKWIWLIFLSLLPLVIISLCGAVVYIIRTKGHLRRTVARPEFVYISGSEPCSEVRLNALMERRMRCLAEAQRLRSRLQEEEPTLDKTGQLTQSDSSLSQKGNDKT